MAGDLSVDIERRFASRTTIAASFRVPMDPGTVIVLFGPSGSGKTTVIRTIAGLDRPDRGTVTLGTDSWVENASGLFVEPQQRRAGYVFQEAALFPHLTVRGNVAYGLSGMSRAEQDGRVREMLKLVEMDDRAGHYPRQLSGGQAQRVALARALAPRPRLLLLDEPFASLDTPTRTRMRTLLRQAVRQLGIGALLVTHDRSEAIALGDQMVVLAEGRVRQVGPVLDVFRRPADLAVAQSVGVESVLPAQVESSDNGLVDLRVGTATVRAVDPGLQGHEVFACIRAEDVTIELAASSSASARNHLPGRITSIDAEGALERVTVDCGFPLAALITRHAREELNLQPGSQVTAAVKATAIHLVARA
ncbi:MAG: ABC transporter ATP-binding protein [Vicinamibacterales bacterium]